MASLVSSVGSLNQDHAQALDRELMSTYGFSIDQLMELAGLSVASVLVKEFPLTLDDPHDNRILIIVGPGNNGGDGLVAARHLKHFGYHPVIVYPKRNTEQRFRNLVVQCQDLDIPFVEYDVAFNLPERSRYRCIVDAIFGFSFQGRPRAPFDRVIRELNQLEIPICAVDIPSGWDIEHGNVHKTGLNARASMVLVSLTAPKIATVKYFQGAKHYLGGRFVPPALAQKYQLQIPKYPGAEQCVELQMDKTT